MINEDSLRDVLIALAQMNRQLYQLVYASMNEIASVRETVRGLDPTFADVLEQRQKEYASRTREVSATSIALTDSLIQRLKDGEVC
jgi:hypothetical protein